jgi:hypothetical protein
MGILSKENMKIVLYRIPTENADQNFYEKTC